MTETALMAVPHQMERDSFLPALTNEQALARYHSLVSFVRDVMKDKVDFDVIPGTTKKTLLKPGAERLCNLFGLSIRFQLLESVEDWSGSGHGEPFFYYRYRCQLFRGDLLMAESEASCNSFEDKYRYREAKRVCPSCGQEAIFKGKEGGWYCWGKKGGCGAKFGDRDASITGQQLGRVANPQIFDQVNTFQKMSQKRALVGTTLLAVNASEFFTQDLEDIQIPLKPAADEVPLTPLQPTPQHPPRSTPGTPTPSEAKPSVSTTISNPRATSVEDMVTPRQFVALNALAKTFSLDLTAECQKLYGCEQKELSRTAASEFIDKLKGYGSQPTPAAIPEPEPQPLKGKTELSREQLVAEIKRGRRKLEKVMSAEKGDDGDLQQLDDADLRVQYRELGKAILNTLKSQVTDIWAALRDYSDEYHDYQLPKLESKTVKELSELKEKGLADLKKEREGRNF